MAGFARAALVNGAAGIVGFDKQERPFAVLGFTVAHGKIVGIDILSDPVRLHELDCRFSRIKRMISLRPINVTCYRPEHKAETHKKIVEDASPRVRAGGSMVPESLNPVK